MKVYSVKVEKDEFHKKLGGGIPAGTLGLIKGESGGGKSVFCQRILYGLFQNDVEVSYVSTQYTTTDFVNQMASLGYRISSYMISDKVRFFPVYPLISEAKQRMDYTKRLMSGMSIFEKDVIIIDSISSLIKFDIEPASVVDLIAFLKRITATGRAVLMTALNGELSEDVIRELESSSTLVVECSIKKFGTDLKNVATIRKFNLAAGQYQKNIAFRVEPGIGLVVEIASVA